MTKARLAACAYGVMFMLGCAYCGKDQAPATAGAGQASRIQLASEDTASDCSACAPGSPCNSLGRCVPQAWYCGPMYYNGGLGDGCDCDCGVVDPDCQIQQTEHWCYDIGRSRRVDSCEACTGALPDVDDVEPAEGG